MSGIFSLSVTDSKGCNAISNTISIVERGADIIAAISAVGPTEVFAPATVMLNAATGLGYAYQWQKNNQNITSATTPTYEAATSGDYSVIVSRDGCSVASGTIKVTVQTPTAISSQAPVSSLLLVYPNPVKNEFVANFTSIQATIAKFYLIDTEGKILNNWTTLESKKDHRIEGSFKNISRGIYLLRVVTPSEVKSISIIKE